MTLQRSGRIIGIDFGTVRIGIAITDPGQSLASPLNNYQRRTAELDKQYFLKLVQLERPIGFVVGLPVHLDGSSNASSQKAEAFGKWLQEITALPVVFFDERFTSAQANEYLAQLGLSRQAKKKVLDKLAAQILLDAYLNSDRNGNTESRSIDR
jgi:putative Holliday junction resolvase